MNICPCCESSEFRLLDDFHLVCEDCGLVVAATYTYVAGIRIKLDFGILL